MRPGVEFSTRWGYLKKDKTTLRPANWPSMPFEPRTERYCIANIKLAEQSSTVMEVTYASDGMRRMRSDGTCQTSDHLRGRFCWARSGIVSGVS